MLVGEDLFFSIPFQKRLMNVSEVDALNELCTTMGLNAVASDVSGSYSQRISKSGEVFHAQTYKRSKKSCSNVVQFCLPNSENDLRYGEIQEFLCIAALNVALVKPFTEVVTNICKNAINSSSDTNVEQFCSKKLHGSHHTPVSFSTDSILIAVLCKDISAKCIVVKTNERFVNAYITPVNDVNCT